MLSSFIYPCWPFAHLFLKMSMYMLHPLNKFLTVKLNFLYAVDSKSLLRLCLANIFSRPTVSLHCIVSFVVVPFGVMQSLWTIFAFISCSFVVMCQKKKTNLFPNPIIKGSTCVFSQESWSLGSCISL